jgi:hypothetical protein
VKEESLDGFAQGLQARRPWGGLQLRRRQEADGGRRLVDNAAEEDIRDRERRLIHTLIHGRAGPFFLMEDGRAGLGCTRTYVVESGSGPFI